MSTTITDSQALPLTLAAADAKGQSAPLPADMWTWALSDPSASGAVLTVSADTLSASLAAGTPASLTVTVTGQSTGLTTDLPVTVTGGTAVAVSIVAGEPVPES